MKLKTADHKSSNVMERILSPEYVTIPPSDHTVFTIQCRINAENAVTGILQHSGLLHEEGDVTFCAALVTPNEGTMGIHVKTFTNKPYKPYEQMKHVRPIDPVSTWHLLNENEEDAVYYISTLLKAKRNNDHYEQNWFKKSDI